MSEEDGPAERNPPAEPSPSPQAILHCTAIKELRRNAIGLLGAGIFGLVLLPSLIIIMRGFREGGSSSEFQELPSLVIIAILGVVAVVAGIGLMKRRVWGKDFALAFCLLMILTYAYLLLWLFAQAVAWVQSCNSISQFEGHSYPVMFGMGLYFVIAAMTLPWPLWRCFKAIRYFSSDEVERTCSQASHEAQPE